MLHQPTIKTYILGAVFVAGSTALLVFGGRPFVKNAFLDLCYENGHTWHHAVAMREGVTLGGIPQEGCSVGEGKSAHHFVDQKEYEFYTRPANVAVALSADPGYVASREALLRFTLTEDGKPFTEATLSHDRLLHAIIISQDFRTFSHVHAEDGAGDILSMRRSGVFEIPYTFRTSGPHLLALDLRARTTAITQFFKISVDGSPAQSTIDRDFARTKTVEGYTVTFGAPEKIRKGDYVTFSYTVMKDGLPVLDLEPYLSAPMHLAIVSETFDSFMHTHGELPHGDEGSSGGHTHHGDALPVAFGPTVNAHAFLGERGILHIFGEFKHKGKVIPTHFAVEVE